MSQTQRGIIERYLQTNLSIRGIRPPRTWTSLGQALLTDTTIAKVTTSLEARPSQRNVSRRRVLTSIPPQPADAKRNKEEWAKSSWEAGSEMELIANLNATISLMSRRTLHLRPSQEGWQELTIVKISKALIQWKMKIRRISMGYSLRESQI